MLPHIVLESAYLICLTYEMIEAKLEVVTEQRMSLVCKTLRLEGASSTISQSREDVFAQ